MSTLRSPQQNSSSKQPKKSPASDSLLTSSLMSPNNYYSDSDLRSIVNSSKSAAQRPHHHHHHGSISSTASSSNASQRHMPRPHHHIHHTRHHNQSLHRHHHPSIHSLHSSQERRRSSVRNHGIPTLETVLENKSVSPYSLFEFQNFMKRSHCFENYMFITEVDALLKFLQEDEKACCEAYNLPQEEAEEEKYSIYPKEDADAFSEKENLIKDLWSHILLVYIATYAEFEINLSYEIRDSLLSYHENCDDMNIHDIPIPEIPAFLDAKDETYVLLQDAFLQFLKSVSNKENNNVFIDKFDIYSKLQNFNLKYGNNNKNSSTAATIISKSSNHSNSTEANSIVSLVQQALFNKNYCLTTTTNNNNNNNSNHFSGLVSPTYGDEIISPSFLSNVKVPANDPGKTEQRSTQVIHSPLSRKSSSSSFSPENIADKDGIRIHDNNYNNNNDNNNFGKEGRASIDDVSKNNVSCRKASVYDSDSDDGLQIHGMKEFIMNSNSVKGPPIEAAERDVKPVSKPDKGFDKDSKQMNNNNTGKNGINLTQLKKMGKKFRLF